MNITVLYCDDCPSLNPSLERLQEVLNKHSIKNIQKIKVIIFSCNHCPYAQAWEDRIVNLQSEFSKDIQIIMISSNDAEQFPDDSFQEMAKRSQEKKFNFPYLYDESQEIATLYGAERTPEVFVFDSSEKEATSIFSDGVKYALQKSKTEAISNLIWGITTVLIGAVALYVLIWAIAWLRFPDHATFGPPGRSPGGPGGPTLIMGIPQPLFIMTLLVGIQCLAVIIYGLSRLLKSWLNFRWLRLRANMTQFELE